MKHTLAKTIIITRVIELIAKQYGVTIDSARNSFYSSKTIELFDDESLGLYGESPLYIFSLYENEVAEASRVKSTFLE